MHKLPIQFLIEEVASGGFFPKTETGRRDGGGNSRSADVGEHGILREKHGGGRRRKIRTRDGELGEARRKFWTGTANANATGGDR